MSWRSAATTLLTAGIIGLTHGHAAGQAQISIGGLIETTAGFETRRSAADDGAATIDERLIWGSRYAPTVDGFVWHRRFLTYSGSALFADQTIDETESRTELVQTEPYRVQFTFFPEAANSVTLRAARATFRTDPFTEDGIVTPTSTTTDTQGFAWSYRGSARLPAAGLEFTRGTTDTEIGVVTTSQTLSTMSLYATKTFERFNPTFRYRLDVLDDEQSVTPGATGSEMGHTFEYSDRIRIGERVFITPSASYSINPVTEDARSVTTLLVPFAGPIDPTLDGAASFRYSLGQAEDLTHTVAADGSLTKRLHRDLTLSGGLNSVLIGGPDASLWSGGGFANVDAAPVERLRTVASYGLQVSGGDPGVSTGHRAQLTATSLHLPKHTLTGSYALNMIQAESLDGTLLTHSWRAGVNSVLLPRTVIDLGYGLERQSGLGDVFAQDAIVSATVTPPLPLVIRMAIDAAERETTGGGRVPTSERGFGVQAGLEGTPFDWLTLNLTGRRGVQQVEREDREGDFVSDRLTGAATLRWRSLTLTTEAFLDREPSSDRAGQGVRGALSFRFRVWTVTLEGERSWYTSVGTHTDQERVLIRVVRPLSHFFRWR